MAKFPMLCVVGGALLMAGCVRRRRTTSLQQKNAAAREEYQQLNQSMSAEVAARTADHAHAGRDQGVGQQRAAVPVGRLGNVGRGEDEHRQDRRDPRAASDSKINVNGYTDNTPIGPGLAKKGVTTNLILSQKRADNVMEYMISQGVKPNLVSAHGFGDANPVASNDTAEGRAQNRRVELTSRARATRHDHWHGARHRKRFLSSLRLSRIVMPHSAEKSDARADIRLHLRSSCASAAAARADGQHDFDFELGTLEDARVAPEQPLSGSKKWVELEGTSVVRAIMDGRANLVELDIAGPSGRLPASRCASTTPRRGSGA